MPFCRSCGGQVPAESAFCGTCGEQLALPPGTPTGSNTFLENDQMLIGASPTLPAQELGSAPQTEPARPGQEAHPVERRQQDQREPFVPLPPVVQPPPSGHIPVTPGTPTNDIPTIHGVPQQASVPTLHNSVQAGNAAASLHPGSPHSPAQPGNAANANHATRPHSPAQPGNAANAHTSQQLPSHQAGSSAAEHSSSAHASTHAQAKNVRAPHRGRWGLRRVTQQSAAHGSAASGAGTAASSGAAAVAVKAIVAIVIIAAAAAGAVKAAPVLFHRGGRKRLRGAFPSPLSLFLP